MVPAVADMIDVVLDGVMVVLTLTIMIVYAPLLAFMVIAGAALYGAIRFDEFRRPLKEIIRKTYFGNLDLVPANLDTRAASRLYVGGGHTIALMQCAGIPAAEMEVFIQQLVRGALAVAS